MVRPLKNTPPTNKPFQSQITCYKDTRNGVGFFGSRVAILDDLADHLLVQRCRHTQEPHRSWQTSKTR